MVAPEVDQADPAGWAYAVLPSAPGLSPLPSLLWESWDVRQAAENGCPGTVIAIARQAHGLHQGQLGKIAGFSQSAISRLEAGGNLAYDVRVLRMFQRLLGIPAHLLGLADESVPLRAADAGRLLGPASSHVTLHGRMPDGRTVPVAVDRHTLLSACTSSVLGGLLDGSGSIRPDGSGPIDPDVVRRLRVVRRLLNESDNWLGSRNLAPAAQQMCELADRMRRAAKGELRRQLLDVTALYGEFCGWLYQEVGDLRGAVEWTERALQQAQAADDRELVAYIHIRMGQFAEVDGDGDRVVGLARAAQREPEISLEVRALALQQEARGHAIAGNASACLSTFDEAATVTRQLRSRWTDEYRIGYYFTEEHLAVQQAAGLLELGQVREAIASYQANLAGRETLCLWEQGVHGAKLARAFAAQGDAEQAARLGFEALAVGRSTGSALVTDELRKLTRYQDMTPVAAVTRALDPVGGGRGTQPDVPPRRPGGNGGTSR
jgi:tetratricopeptide (TPR) repeat protein